ncbi:MAG: UDP-N-acetylmuramoyl-L-alanine--D-glutamate ligase, partial [Clostridiales bacterium]|nr:UDP-N-acetylmuramoyl-L-alanine--D-glutamate ligase [Clostridiales bacterium]
MLFEMQTFLVAGLSRSGISAANYLLDRGAKVYLFDDVEEEHVKDAALALKNRGAVILKRDEIADHAERCDVLVLSPGIPVDHPLPVSFRRLVKRIIGEAELGALALRCPVIAVTGTNGKTTTTSI